MTTRPRIALTVHRLFLEVERTPLRRLGRLVYRGLARAGAVYLAWGERGAAAYVRGGIATHDFLPGLSDIDVALVLAPDPARPGAPGERARKRWQHLVRAVPVAQLLFDWPRIYDEGELHELAGSSAFTYGLGKPSGGGAAYLAPDASLDKLRLLERPGLYGTTSDWRLLRGPDRRPAERDRDAEDRRIAAWLELLYWWRWVFPASVDAGGPRTVSLCCKLVAEPARIWLWLAHGQRVASREDALELAARRMPDEEEALRRVLGVLRSLRDSPALSLAEVLPTLVRMSERIAGLIAAEVDGEGSTAVRLQGAEPAAALAPDGARRGTGARGGRVLPLCDWRSLACPTSPDESFVVVPGDPGDAADVGRATRAQQGGAYCALSTGGLMVLPAVSLERTRLRAIKSPLTDPVSFALAAGSLEAVFPDVRGWSADDTARRAVAEHRAWLSRFLPGGKAASPDDGATLVMLLTAARAGLFQRSLGERDAALAVTAAETIRQLGAGSAAAAEALDHYRAFALRGEQPSVDAVAALRELVLELPAYTGLAGPRPALRRPDAPSDR